MLTILFVLILHISCQCNIRTSIYNSHGKSNDNYWYFDPQTYIKTIDIISVSKYRELIKGSILCTGQWCINKEWKCNLSNSRDCYNVEHIIPTANKIKEIANCSTDILGNLIMSYGAWIEQSSNGYYGEKAIIYGNRIVESAYRSVYQACHNKEPNYIPDELCIPSSSGFYLTIFFIAVTLAVLSCVGVYTLWQRHKDERKYELYTL